MSENTVSLTFDVQVRIDKWRDGQHGRYGFATVLSVDAPTTQAFYGVSKFKIIPALGEPFDCSIKLVKDRWQVVAIAAEPEPVEKQLSGHIKSYSGIGMQRSWQISLDADSGEDGSALLATDVLRKARIAHLEIGQELTFVALSSLGGMWTVTKVLSPVVADAVDAFSADAGCIVFALRDWSLGDDAKSVLFAINAPPSKVWPLLYVQPKLLQAQSIRTVLPAELDDPYTLTGALQHLADVAEVLQSGSPEALADVHVHCLKVTLRWDASGYWNVARLLAPLSLREPNKGEVLDWVKGCVTALQQKALSPDTVAPSADGLSQPKSQTRPPSVLVKMDINDPRVGRGNVSGYIKADIVNAAGLAKGVQTVVLLRSNKTFWNIKSLHRSTPLRDDV